MKRTNVPGLIRDERTGAILNTDTASLDSIRARRADLKSRRGLEQRVAVLERQLREVLEKLCQS